MDNYFDNYVIIPNVTRLSDKCFSFFRHFLHKIATDYNFIFTLSISLFKSTRSSEDGIKSLQDTCPVYLHKHNYEHFK